MQRDFSVMIGVLIALLAFSVLLLGAVRLFFHLLERVAQQGIVKGEDTSAADHRTEAR